MYWPHENVCPHECIGFVISRCNNEGKLLIYGSSKKTLTKESDIAKVHEEQKQYWEEMESFHRNEHHDGEHPVQEILRKYFQKSTVSGSEIKSSHLEKKAFSGF